MGSTVVGTQKRRIAAKHQAAPLARCLDIHWTGWKSGGGRWAAESGFTGSAGDTQREDRNLRFNECLVLALRGPGHDGSSPGGRPTQFG